MATGGRRLPLVDCDVHQMLRNPKEELLPYLSAGWREFAAGGSRVAVETAVGISNPDGPLRADAVPPEGGPPGSSPSWMAAQLLDPHGVNAAILTGDGALYLSGITNPHFARELARAYNDHLIDHWLSVDSRFKGSIGLALQVPEWAAEEIRRLAGRPDFVQVAIAPNPLPYPFGHPIFDPVHRACAETGMPLGIHALGDVAAGAIPSHLASGYPTLYAEYNGGAAQGLMTHFMSFVFHGVFERYPELRVILIEGGVGWVVPLLRRLDLGFNALRREVPWCKKLPSEYFRDHVRLTTQPLEIDRPDEELILALDRLGAADFLLFSSDYPHWDADVPTTALALLPQHWRARVAYENAASLFSLDVPV